MKLRELNIIEDAQVRHGVEYARMTGTLDVPKHLVEHALAQLPEGWADSELHKIVGR